jgi:hypothetical protein
MKTRIWSPLTSLREWSYMGAGRRSGTLVNALLPGSAPGSGASEASIASFDHTSGVILVARYDTLIATWGIACQPKVALISPRYTA